MSRKAYCVGSLVSNSDNFTIEGGNLNANSIDITTDTLTVVSLQDTASSNSKSAGMNVGGSTSSSSSNNTTNGSSTVTSTTVTSNSLNGGINASQSNANSAWVNQQSGITGGTVNITAKDTTLTGAVIAAVDEQGQTTDQLTLTTGTLTVANLQDTDKSKSMGMDLSVSAGSTSVGGSFNGHEKEQTTKATIGLGNVTVGGTSIDEQAQFADLNRDTNNSQETTKDMERGGVDISLTVDNRMLTEKGRDQIAEDFLKSGMLVDTAVLAATTDRVGLLDFNEELGKTHTVYETVKDAIANDKVLAKQLQDPNLSAADKEVMLDQLTHAVMNKLGYETEGYENTIFADKTAVAQDENDNLGAVAGFYSEQTGDSYINDANIDDTSGIVRVAGHESSHAMDDQDVKNTGVNYSDSDKETYAYNFGNNLDKYTNLALDINGYDSGMATTNSHVGNDSRYVADNTKEYQGLDKSKGDNCFGLCVGAVVLASTAIYALLEGDGDAAEGVMKIGRGDDTISKGLGKVNEAVDAAAYEVAPEFTQTVADTKQAIGGFTNEVVTYVDEKSGKRVSGTWNELSPETQDFLKGSGIILSVVAPAARTASLATPDVDLSLNNHSGSSTGSFGSIGDGSLLNKATGTDLTPVVVSSMPGYLNHQATSGIKLVANPDNTTSILGSYVSDISKIIDELDYPKNLDFEAKKSGFNILNTPDEFYKSPHQFWNEYNKPFLDKAIQRGDDIVLATKPTTSTLNRTLPDGTVERSGYGREIDYLKSHGYSYDAKTNKMVKEE